MELNVPHKAPKVLTCQYEGTRLKHGCCISLVYDSNYIYLPGNEMKLDTEKQLNKR